MENKISEICQTCAKFSTCKRCVESKHRILSCDEFEKSKTNEDSNHLEIENHEFTRDKGLCTNCTKRTYCTLNRPEGGVWHCNEYN